MKVLIVGTAGSDELSVAIERLSRASGMAVRRIRDFAEGFNKLKSIHDTLDSFKIDIVKFQKLAFSHNPNSWIPQEGAHCSHWDLSIDHHTSLALTVFITVFYHRKCFMRLKTFRNLRF